MISIVNSFGIDENIIKRYLNEDVLPSKRMKEMFIDNRPVFMLESKNENNLSYYESLHYIKEVKGKKVLEKGFELDYKEWEFKTDFDKKVIY